LRALFAASHPWLTGTAELFSGSLGFVVTRQRGSHIMMRRGSSGCVVPNHHELKLGTLVGLLKQAGISPEEFIEAINA
jgi:predicted RNA binding protein YcfA (HicA-like mRNA interferase family)